MGGMASYIRALVAELQLRLNGDLVIITSAPDELPEPVDVGARCSVVVIPRETQGFVQRQRWRESNLLRIAREQRSDVVVIPAPEAPIRAFPLPVVVVVHDIGPLVMPQFWTPAKRARYRLLLPRSLRKANAIVCSSQSTASQLWSRYPNLAERTTVIGLGPELRRDQMVTRASSVRPVTALCVGSDMPHKNLRVLTSAVANLDVRLTLVGPGTERYDGAFENVRGLGWVSPVLYESLQDEASLFVSPSLYEGFGIPVVESMAAGLPCLLSDIPIYREVAGDAAFYVSEPQLEASWERDMRLLLGDPGTLDDLCRRGPIQSKNWTWTAMGEQFVAVLHSLC
jgi:glycosyltransferase involved in cell wall biosynthesis